MNEKRIIKELYKGANPSYWDDCYLLDGKYLITTDSLSENTHFRHDWSSPSDLACKLITLNCSDIISSGGIPTIAFLNLGLSSHSKQTKWLNSFIKEFKKLLKHYKIELAGGDTYSSSITNLTLTLFGIVKRPVTRIGAKIGDSIYITGSLGLSILGLKYLEGNIDLPPKLKKEALEKHLCPQVRFFPKKDLPILKKITSMMDISDGLYQDSQKLSIASDVHLQIDINTIPLFDKYFEYLTIDEILNSGEEAEYLFTYRGDLPESSIYSKIGLVTSGKAQVTFKLNQKKYSPQYKGFVHFEK